MTSNNFSTLITLLSYLNVFLLSVIPCGCETSNQTTKEAFRNPESFENRRNKYIRIEVSTTYLSLLYDTERTEKVRDINELSDN